MIELEKTYISSSMEAQIAEMIGRDEKSNDYRFYHLFSSLVFDKTKKELRFPILREIWESGVAKKFKVIPIVDLQSKTKEEYV